MNTEIKPSAWHGEDSGGRHPRRGRRVGHTVGRLRLALPLGLCLSGMVVAASAALSPLSPEEGFLVGRGWKCIGHTVRYGRSESENGRSCKLVRARFRADHTANLVFADKTLVAQWRVEISNSKQTVLVVLPAGTDEEIRYFLFVYTKNNNISLVEANSTPLAEKYVQTYAPE